MSSSREVIITCAATDEARAILGLKGRVGW